MAFTEVLGQRIEYERLGAEHAERGTIVMLHEGLGSCAMWRDFPQRLAERAQSEVIVYSRLGYGASAPHVAPRSVRYMHEEALQTLPQLLDAWGVEQPILLGHSDGGSIALIHAGGTPNRVAGVIALAPHVLVEELSVRSIEAARTAYQSTDLRARLARYHEDVDGAFWGWNNIWLHPDFRAWNIEECLPRISCPILAIQGEDDPYGTMEQIERIARGAREVQLLKLPRCGHSAHRDQPEPVLEAIEQWLPRARRGDLVGSATTC